jgi:hypothetical protein
MADPLPGLWRPDYHWCDYCDQPRADTVDITTRAGRVLGYACLYCVMLHSASIARRKDEG